MDQLQLRTKNYKRRFKRVNLETKFQAPSIIKRSVSCGWRCFKCCTVANVKENIQKETFLKIREKLLGMLEDGIWKLQFAYWFQELSLSKKQFFI